MHTAEQLTAARATVGWTRAELGAASEVSPETVKRLEGQTGALSGNSTTINALRAALEANGVMFLAPGDASPGHGICMAASINENEA